MSLLQQMLNLLYLLFLVIAVYGQTDSPKPNPQLLSISAGCQAELAKISTSACGPQLNSSLSTGMAAGVIPGLPSNEVLLKELGTFCTKECSDSLDLRVKTLLSPACNEFTAYFEANGMAQVDIPAIINMTKSLACVKDGSNYCFPAFASLARTSDSTNALQNQAVVCTTCFNLEKDALRQSTYSFSPKLQDAFQSVVDMMNQALSKCSSLATNSAMKSAFMHLMALSIGFAL